MKISTLGIRTDVSSAIYIIRNRGNMATQFMLKLTDTTKYCIYPSWADFEYQWESLPTIFSHPQKYINKQWYNEEKKSSFEINPSRQEFVSGPKGGGIIIHDYIPDSIWRGGYATGKRWIGDAVFNIEEYELNSLGEPDTREHPANVCYLTRRGTRLLIKLGIQERPNPQYHIFGSFDHVESVGDCVYVALVCDKNKRQKNKILGEFIELAANFGVNLDMLNSTPAEILYEKRYWFRDESNLFYWFSLHADTDNVQELFSYLVYCGLHLRKQGSVLRGIQIAAQIESSPCGRLSYLYCSR